MADEIPRNVWVGLVSLQPRPGNDELEGGLGASTNAVARADGEAAFRSIVEAVFADLGYDVLDIEEIERADDREDRGALSEVLREAARHVATTDEAGWDTFRVYTAE